MMLDTARKLMNRFARFVFAVALLSMPISSVAAGVSGTWSAKQRPSGEVQFNFYESGSRSQNGFNVPLSELTGIDAQQMNAAQPATVSFALRRPAGTIDMRGVFEQGEGSGFYTFSPNDSFITAMRDLGYRDLDDRRLFLFATTELTPEWVRDIRALGYTPTRDDLEEIAIFKVTPQYVREIRAEGFPSVTIQDLVQLRIGKIDAARIAEYRALGLKDVSADAIGELGIMKVTPDYIREIAAAGYPSLSPSELTELRIGRISAEVIRDYRALGYTNVPASQLGEAGIQHVTPEFIRSLANLGYRNIPLSQLTEMRIFYGGSEGWGGQRAEGSGESAEGRGQRAEGPKAEGRGSVRGPGGAFHCIESFAVLSCIPVANGKGMFRLRFLLIAFFLTAIPAHAALRLEVDLSERELRVLDDNNVVKQYDVAVGTREKPTPTGAFAIDKIVWNPSWHPPDEKWARGKDPKGPGDPDNPMKRVKIFFSEPDYYIHGTDAVDSLGRAESHGCVRMSESEVTELAKLLMTHGGKPKPEPWYRRIFHSRSTTVVMLTNKIPIVVEK
jgi:L,D-transpeptidase catalytic domain